VVFAQNVDKTVLFLQMNALEDVQDRNFRHLNVRTADIQIVFLSMEMEGVAEIVTRAEKEKASSGSHCRMITYN
jgi:hypothetical protein